MEAFAALMLLGVRVREVRDLAEGAVYAAAVKVLFVDDSLNHGQRETVCQQILGRLR